MRRFMLFLVIWILFPSILKAQDITGDWYGLLDVQATKLRLIVHIQPQGDGYSGTLDSQDQDAFGIPLSEVLYDQGQFIFRLASAALEYSGKVSSDFTSIDGTFTQSGQSFTLNFGRTMIVAPEGSPEWAKGLLNKQEVMITMRDGVRLFTSIYTPKDSTQNFPILLWRTPYNSEPAGEASYSTRLGLATHLISDGYAIVFQDVRGRYMSEGTFMDVRPYNPDRKNNQDIDENSDTFDTIDWLVNNVPNNNGRVGIYGISYPGFYATMSLPQAHPALKAVSPQAPVTD